MPLNSDFYLLPYVESILLFLLSDTSHHAPLMTDIERPPAGQGCEKQAREKTNALPWRT